jgi:DNA primase
MIPKNFIDDLLARIDIVEIIGTRVQLRKTGSNFTALCPFHTEKTPSFTVSPNKQFYYCFGCGAHGNAIGFLMDFDRMEFVDAIETLASHLGIEVPKETNTKQQPTQQLFKLLNEVNKYYQRQLRQSNKAINYLKARGLSGEICKRFNIGYAPCNWDNLLKGMDSRLCGNDKQLVSTGMLIKKDDHFYDRFRDRIMFPIRDQRGNIIAFGGRTLGDDKPKYLNSPETPLFNKGSELYGLFEAKQANRDLPYIIIVEGYMDVISLAQHGISCAVATLGTATTTRHVQKLFRYTPKIIFCFDGDDAGKKAAWRALENTLPLMRDGVQAAFLFLPDNEDPDSQIRKEGKENFIKRIKTAIPLSEFFFRELQEQINLTTMDGQAQMAQQASMLLKKMPAGVFQQLMFEKLAKLVHLDITKLRNLQNNEHAVQKKQKTNDLAKAPSLIRSAIKLLLHYPQLAQYVENPEQIVDINIANVEFLAQLLMLLKKQPDFTTGNILEYWRDKKEAPALAKLAAQEIPIPAQNLKNEFIDTIKRLYEYGREQTIQELLKQANNKNISNKDKYKLQKLISDAKIRIWKNKG